MNRRLSKQKERSKVKVEKVIRPLGIPMVPFEETVEWASEVIQKSKTQTPTPAMDRIKYIGIISACCYLLIFMWMMINQSKTENKKEEPYISIYAVSIPSETPSFQSQPLISQPSNNIQISSDMDDIIKRINEVIESD